MKKIVIVILFISICNTSCNTKEKTPEELRMELKTKEETSPDQYLEIDAIVNDSIVQTRRAGLFHNAEYAKDGNVIRGSIKNSASVAKFKDVVLTVSYYSATDTEIKSEDFIVYEYYEPNSAKAFSLHVHAPDAMKRLSVAVKTAVPVY